MKSNTKVKVLSLIKQYSAYPTRRCKYKRVNKRDLFRCHPKAIKLIGKFEHRIDHFFTDNAVHPFARVLNIIREHHKALAINKQRRMLDYEIIEKSVVYDCGQILLRNFIQTGYFSDERYQAFNAVRDAL